MQSEDYFRDARLDRQVLLRHGLDHWPDGEELARRLFEAEDAIAALARASGLAACRNAHGHWTFYPVDARSGPTGTVPS